MFGIDITKIWENFTDARGWFFPDPNEFIGHKLAQWTDPSYVPPEEWSDGKGFFGTISDWLDSALGWILGFLPGREMPFLNDVATTLDPATINFTDAPAAPSAGATPTPKQALAQKLETNMLAAAKEAVPSAYSGASLIWKPGNDWVAENAKEVTFVAVKRAALKTLLDETKLEHLKTIPLDKLEDWLKSNSQFATYLNFAENAGRQISDQVRQAILDGKVDNLKTIDGAFEGLDGVVQNMDAIKDEMKWINDAYGEMKGKISAQVLNSWSEEQKFEFAAALAKGMKAEADLKASIALAQDVDVSAVVLTVDQQKQLDRDNLTAHEVDVFGSIPIDRLMPALKEKDSEIDSTLNNFLDMDITTLPDGGLDSHTIAFQGKSGSPVGAYVKQAAPAAR